MRLTPGAGIIFGKGVKLRLEKIFGVLIFSTITFLLIGCGSKAAIGSTPIESIEPVDSELTFTISSDKQIYSLNEEIFITMSLRNNSDKPLIVNEFLLSDRTPRPFGVVAFTIYGPTGDLLIFHVFQDYLSPPSKYFVPLSPNDSTSEKTTISSEYNFDQIGIYTISAEYNNQIDSPDGREAWKGTLESNTIMIEVVP